jgi:hypothetical protein
MEGVNSTVICCKNFCKCHSVPPVQHKKEEETKQKKSRVLVPGLPCLASASWGPLTASHLQRGFVPNAQTYEVLWTVRLIVQQKQYLFSGKAADCSLVDPSFP